MELYALLGYPKIVLQFELENNSEIREFEFFIVVSNILLLFILLFLMLKVIRPIKFKS